MVFLIKKKKLEFDIRNILIGCLLLFTSVVSAQQKSVTIAGVIFEDSLKPLFNCYIKVLNKSSNQIIIFSNTGNVNSFSVNIPFSKPDTFVVTISHVGYISSIRKLYVADAGSTISAEFLLPLEKKILDDVVMNAPPVWVRGDTTFFKAEYFKDGDEKKLIDLITKMPGFEIDDNGNLLFKKKRVEKVMIEGEELFAEKVKLLLSNFPVHVIENIQAIENQSNNRLLKGLTGENRIFLNIGLSKKAKLKATFGDGEAGIGTENQYFFNPVLFSLYNKLKLGYIGNWNSIGQGFGWKEEDELKNDPIRMAEQWMMNPHSLQIINNFESKRYISNRQFGNRLEINTPLNKSIKSKLQLDFITDRQLQNSYYSSSLFSDSLFFKRSDTNAVKHSPAILKVNEDVEWTIDSSKVLKMSTGVYYNGLNSTHFAIYNQQAYRSSVYNSIKNSYTGYHFITELSTRIAADKAMRWFINIDKNINHQYARGESSSWSTIFGLQDSSYTVLKQDPRNNFITAKAGWELIKKSKAGLFINGFSFTRSTTDITNKMTLNDPGDKSKILQLPEYSLSGKYNVNKFIGNTRTSIKTFQVPLVLTAEYGFAYANIQETGESIVIKTPVYNLNITQKAILFKVISSSISTSYEQNQAEAFNLYRIVLPTSLTSFNTNANLSQPLRTVRANSSFSFFWPRKLSNTNLQLLYTRNLSSFISAVDFSGFLQKSQDSIVSSPTSRLSISTTSTIPSTVLKSTFTISGGLHLSERYLVSRGNLLPMQMRFYWAHFTFKKNWNKRFYINGESGYSTSKAQLPDDLKGSLNKEATNFKFHARQRVVVQKNLWAALNTEFYSHNINTPNHSSFVFVDFESSFTFPKKPVSLTLNVGNLLNQQTYTSNTTLPLIQTFFTVPLISRNVLMSIRYEL